MVKLLLEAGADANRVENLIDGNGKPCDISILAYAIINGNREIVQLLLKYGASWDTQITFGGTTKSVKKFPFKAKKFKYSFSKEYFDSLKSMGCQGSFFL